MNLVCVLLFLKKKKGERENVKEEPMCKLLVHIVFFDDGKM